MSDLEYGLIYATIGVAVVIGFRIAHKKKVPLSVLLMMGALWPFVVLFGTLWLLTDIEI